jgi:hypothetical protein
VKATTIGEQSRAFSVVHVLVHHLPHLPAASIELSSWHGDGGTSTLVTIHLHDTLSDFETWREALGIDPDAVTASLSSHRLALRAATVRDGVEINVIAYGEPVPAAAHMTA